MNDDVENDGDGENIDDAWGEALAEQKASSEGGETDAGAEEDDPWGAALAEQRAAEGGGGDDDFDPDELIAATKPAAPAADPYQPANLEARGGSLGDAEENLRMILDIPVNLSIEVGRARIPIKNLLQLSQGSVVELDRLAGEPMDVLVNDTLIAQGEVVVVNDKYGIRLTDIISHADRIKRLTR